MMKISEDAGKGIEHGANGVSRLIQTWQKNKWGAVLFVSLCLIAYLLYDNVQLRHENFQIRDAIIADQRKQLDKAQGINNIIDTSKNAMK